MASRLVNGKAVVRLVTMALSSSYLIFAALHFVCFALAMAVCVLYGVDLCRVNQVGVRGDSKWLTTVARRFTPSMWALLSAVTCVVYLVPVVLRVASLFAAVWDFVLFLLWITLFGIIGKIFIDEDHRGNGAIQQTNTALWIDLASTILWLFATTATLAHWWRHRDLWSRFTERARV